MTARSIARSRLHPLRAVLAKTQRTSQGDYPAIEIVVVEVVSSDGIVGYGEGLARRGAAAYAHFIDEVLTPRLLGKDPADRRALWKAMRAVLSGRPGGQLVEAIAAVDIALWDMAGKAANLPIHKLLGGMGRQRVPPMRPRSTGSTTPRSRPRSRRRARPASARSRSSSAIRSRTQSRAHASSASSPATTSRSMSMPTGPMTSTMR
jgi:L-alanine-DL-glutamate epimerase-like enolase superfamily enzyme